MVKFRGRRRSAALYFMDSLLSTFDREFTLLDGRTRKILDEIEPAQLFARPAQKTSISGMVSTGEYLLRSAAMVEKTFGGLTTRLWDDPFEWTLPEEIRDCDGLRKYLDEVEATRVNGFAFFSSDDDLSRRVPSPVILRPIVEILMDTLVKASHYQGRAFAVHQLLTGRKLPQV